MNKGVLINGIARGDFFLEELFFSKSYFLGGVGSLGKKGGHSLFLLFFSHFHIVVI